MSQACSRCGTFSAAAMAAGLCPGCLLRLAALPESRTPDYEIETLLGEGIGTSYLARESGTGNLLAVKTLGAAATPETIEALDDLRARLLSFRHPLVAPLLALEVDAEGSVRMIRAFVGGRPLDEWLEGATARAKTEARQELDDAIRQMHAAGLAHGHLVGTNILVTANGRFVITDHAARVVAGIVNETQSDPDPLRQDDLARLAALMA